MGAADPVVVVGGGLAGLSAAQRLVRQSVPVVVLEAGSRFGGQIHTIRERDAVIELGAEGFVARSVALPTLCGELGIQGDLVDQLTTLTYAATDGGLVPLAPGEAAELLGFQIPREELGRGIRSLARGMGQIVDALSRFLAERSDQRLGAPVRSVERDGRGLGVLLESGDRLPASGVVLAVGSRSAAPILERISEGASRVLETARTMSSLSVVLLYERDAIARELDASGFIVPAARQVHGFRACSFVSSKFAGRAPSERVLLRAFCRPEGDSTAVSDAEWVERALEVIAPVLGVRGSPIGAWVSRWVDALPLFDDRHHENVRTVEATIESKAVFLAGSAFHGAGIDAAVRSAERAASRIRRS